MHKKFLVPTLVVGLLLSLAGVAVLAWAQSEQERQKQLLQEQQESLNTELDKLDRVLAGEIDVHSFAGTVPDENREQELNKYISRMETRELVFVVSILCISAGGVISAFCFLLWISQLISKGTRSLLKFFSNLFGWREAVKDKYLANAERNRDEQALEQSEKLRDKGGLRRKLSTVLANSGGDSFDTSFANQYEPAASEDVVSAKNESHCDTLAKDADMAGVGFAKDKSLVPEGFWTGRSRGCNTSGTQLGQARGTDEKTALLDSRDNNSEVEDLVRTQTENLEKQMAEFKQMAQSVQQSAVEHSEPLKNLTEQVSAIREYALQQQGRMEKLQDGYDWNIIRTFCLRIIRCIDNLETRIAGLSEQDVEAVKLKEVRDELIFALESSGIERFEPEIKSNYRGQERRAEAVKEKQQCDDPKLKGKVARVTRSGYQYVIDEENVKVVRTAQVELFDYVGQMKQEVQNG
jgi:molecular chaperone GrpE (heat shock protein)